jgi:cytochrome c biogenesis protein CcdA
MVLLGLLITLLGFVISFLSLGMTTSVNARMVMVLIGIAVSFTGIIGVMNRAYLKNALWRK